MNIKIRSFSISLLIAAGIVLILALLSFNTVFERFKRMSVNYDNYVLVQASVRRIESASDFLTNSTRQFVITKESRFVNDYFFEVFISKNRENALTEIKRLLETNSNFETKVFDSKSFELLENAVAESNKLMVFEIYAMKLILTAMEYSQQGLPSEITQIELYEDDKNLSKSQKIDKAYNLVFGEKYAEEKKKIDNELSFAISKIEEYTNAQKEKSFEMFKNSLINQLFCVLFFILIIVLSFISVIYLVIRPLRIAVKCIQNDSKLKPIGSYEFKYLSDVYNKMYQGNVESQNKLKHQAEHDVLTGILNRRSFENLTSNFNEDEKLALLLVDVDNFKSINDNYGHEKGDVALQLIASLLTDNFRANDLAFRYGGDEFAVIMMNLIDMSENNENLKANIEQKINLINHLLQIDSFGVGFKFSVSVGIAFSKNGYSLDVFNKADEALYKTKRNGRCGLTFSE